MDISIDAHHWKSKDWKEAIVKVSFFPDSIDGDSIELTLLSEGEYETPMLISIKRLEWAIAKLRECQELGLGRKD